VAIPSYDDYVATLSRLTEHVDPTTPAAETAATKVAAESLAALEPIDVTALAQWTRDNPQAVPILGLTAGPSQEKLENALKQHTGTVVPCGSPVIHASGLARELPRARRRAERASIEP
jgi:hypothetical protein